MGKKSVRASGGIMSREVLERIADNINDDNVIAKWEEFIQYLLHNQRPEGFHPETDALIASYERGDIPFHQLEGILRHFVYERLIRARLEGRLREDYHQGELAYEGGEMPPEKMFFKTAEESYSATPQSALDGFSLVVSTPTLKAYLKDKTLLIGLRGTKLNDKRDLVADVKLPFNLLKGTDRYKTDKATFEAIVKRYPPQDYEYYISGHSLGGAIDNQLKYDFPFIKNAVEYNPAFQAKDLFWSQKPEIKRIYTDKDGLYNLGGKLFRNNKVIPAKSATGVSAIDAISGHILSNFGDLYKGGGKISRRKIMKGSGYSPLAKSVMAKDVVPQERARRMAELIRWNEIGRHQKDVVDDLMDLRDLNPTPQITTALNRAIADFNAIKAKFRSLQDRDATLRKQGKGGSKKSGYVRKLIAEGKLDPSKVKKPSANIKARMITRRQELLRLVDVLEAHPDKTDVYVSKSRYGDDIVVVKGQDPVFKSKLEVRPLKYESGRFDDYVGDGPIMMTIPYVDGPYNFVHFSIHPRTEDDFDYVLKNWAKELRKVIKEMPDIDDLVSGGASGGKMSRSSGFIKLMIAKKHLKRNPEDYPIPPKDQPINVRDKITPKRFVINRIANPSSYIKKRFKPIPEGEEEDSSEEEQEVEIPTLKRKGKQSINRPFKKGERATLTEAQHKQLKIAERIRQWKSKAKKEGLTLQEYFKAHPSLKTEGIDISKL